MGLKSLNGFNVVCLNFNASSGFKGLKGAVAFKRY